MMQRFFHPWYLFPVLLLILLLPMAGSGAETYPPQDWPAENPASDFSYHQSDDGQGIVIDGYIGEDFWEAVIPKEIDGLPVVEIADFAFYSHNGDTVSRVCMPDTVERIGKEVFYYSDLVSVRLSENLKSIGADAFTGTGLTEIQLPASLEELDHTALQNIPSLTDIIVEGNPRYTFENGLLIEDGVVIVYPGGRGEPFGDTLGGQGEAHIDIPTGTVGIDASVFKDKTGIESVSIPNTVTYVGSDAFSGCVSLKEVQFKEGGLVALQGGAFSGCTSLASVRLAAYSLGDYTFSGCSALSKVELLPGLYSIGRGAFSGCSGLEELPLPPGLAYINARAFYGTAIHSLKIPDSILQIEPGDFYHGDRAEAFFGMPGLTEVIIDANPVYRMDGKRLVMDSRVLFDPRIQENWYEFDEMKAVADGLMAYRTGDKWGLLTWALGINAASNYESIGVCACLGKDLNIGIKDGREYEIGPNQDEFPHRHNESYQKEFVYWDEEREYLYDETGESFDFRAMGWGAIGAFPVGAAGVPYEGAKYVLVVDDTYLATGERFDKAYSDLETYSGTAALALSGGVWRVYDYLYGWLPDYTFQEARDFSHGFAAVKTDMGWGFVNNHGALVTDTFYDEVTEMNTNEPYPLYAYGRKDGIWRPILPAEGAAELMPQGALPGQTAPPPAPADSLNTWRDQGLPLCITGDFGKGEQTYYAVDYIGGLLAFKGLGFTLGLDGLAHTFHYGSVSEEWPSESYYDPVMSGGAWYLQEDDMYDNMTNLLYWYLMTLAEDQRAEKDIILDDDNHPAVRMDHVAEALENFFFYNVSFTENSPLDWIYSVNGGPPQSVSEYELMEWDGNVYMAVDVCLALAQRITNGE